METEKEKKPRKQRPKKTRLTVFLPGPVAALVTEDMERLEKSASEVLSPIVEAYYRQQGRL